MCCNRTKTAKPRIAMFSRLCTDGRKGFLFGNFYLREFFTFSMQDFGLNAVSGVEINEGGRGIQRLFWQLFPYFPIFLESLLCRQERENDVNGSQK